MNDPDDWPTWLAANPYPDMQTMANRFGGYSKITPQAWDDFDRACHEWNQKRLERLTASYAGLKRRI